VQFVQVHSIKPLCEQQAIHLRSAALSTACIRTHPRRLRVRVYIDWRPDHSHSCSSYSSTLEITISAHHQFLLPSVLLLHNCFLASLVVIKLLSLPMMTSLQPAGCPCDRPPLCQSPPPAPSARQRFTRGPLDVGENLLLIQMRLTLLVV